MSSYSSGRIGRMRRRSKMDMHYEGNPRFCFYEVEGRRLKTPRVVSWTDEFRKLMAVSACHFVKHNPSLLFGKFLKSRYLNFVHPKMEFAFSGNLNKRKAVNAGELPETELFKMFGEMARRVWLRHYLAFSFDGEMGIFQVEKDSRFLEVYMENIADDVFTAAAGDLRVAFTVVSGF